MARLSRTQGVETTMHRRNPARSFASALTLAAAFAVTGASPVIAHGQANSNKLQQVLSQMDAASKNFKSAQADIKRVHLEKLVNDVATETGTMYFLRNGNSTQVGGRF